MWPIVSGFIGGIIAWVATTVIGQPLQRFLALRHQAAIVLAKYDDRPWIGNPEAKPPSNEWLKERSQAFDKIGSELVAFADSNTFVARYLQHRFLGPYRCHVRTGGETLRTLGDAYPGTESWNQLRQSAMSKLKIAGWPRDVR